MVLNIRERASMFFIWFIILLFLITAALSADTGLWNDETILNTYTQNFPLEEVCIGTVCTQYQLSITNNASINGSPICTPQNDHCNTNGSSSLVHGELFLHTDSADGYSTPMNTSPTAILNFSNGTLNGVGSVNNSLTIITTGTYLLNWHLGFSSSAPKDYQITVSVNNVERPHCETHRDISAGNDVGAAAGTCIEILNAEDTVTLSAHITVGTASLKAYGGNLNVLLIGQ